MAQTFPAPSGGVVSTRHRPGFVLFCAVMALVTLIGVAHARSAGRSAIADGHRNARVGRDRDPSGADRAERTPAPVAPAVSGDAEAAALASLAAVGQPVFCGGEGERVVALTFDDGPGPYTQETLDLLRAHGMTATFFLVGKLLADPRFTDLPREEANLGAIGDHTWDHISVSGLGSGELDHQIADTRHALADATGSPVELFRPPLGQHDETVDRWVSSHGMVEVLWSIDTQDSMGARSSQILAEVRDHLAPGAIILLHENRGTTQNALPAILHLIEAQGYRTVTVPQLLAMDPPTSSQLESHACA